MTGAAATLEWIEPSRRGAGLADVLPAAAIALGAASGSGPGGFAAAYRRSADRLPFAPTRSVCLLLIDGLGEHNLARFAAYAPTLAALRASHGRRIRTGFPSTTATSVASLLLGRTPGEHGMFGYEAYDPASGATFSHLRWDTDISPEAWQPQRTMFELLESADIRTTHIGPPRFETSGLTRATARAGRFSPATTPDELVDATVAAVAAGARKGGRSVTYTHWSDVDRAGHTSGVDSPEWTGALAAADLAVASLRRRLPRGTLLLITADHGMVDVDPALTTDIAEQPELADTFVALAGEPRALHVILDRADGGPSPENVDESVRIWSDRLGARARVVSGEAAIARGWFGPSFSDGLRGRIGDLIVASTGGSIVIDSRHHAPGVARMIGQHGSLTRAEVEVPFITVVV